MTILNYDIEKVRRAYKAVHEMRIQLEDFQDGSPAPSVSLGRFTAAEMNAQITKTVQVLNSMSVPTTVVALVTGGTYSVTGTATSQLTATATLADLTTDVVTTDAVWSTSDPDVATVGAATGLVTGVAPGTCDITATYKEYTVTKTFTVNSN